MATRRTASRTRVNNNTNPMPHPPPHRSRTAMSRSASLTRSVDESQSRELAVTTATAKPQKVVSSQDDTEMNIQVVIRCRRRSEREIQDNSPIIVSSTGAKSKDVSIETSAPASSLGIVTLPPLRTYPFDLVFGPEADQAMIYHDVVTPMLNEVLMGYNCTLFAYGQTGTGKTYTMQGDLTPTPMGNPSINAGMIPRVLFRLFHHLETSKTDYSVKISYIELYNEELRDLLANELGAPIGTIQPMGMATKDTNKNTDNGLKIFDDANKRGVLIQGLEEITVKDSQGALALLTKGSHRRQIAATKFNDHSSRSHSVFSVTVHIKEASAMGEDLLKVGKLNLVDLAGSENIGRSGAENKRAREAGMINQSLLTLGRVINALVDKAQHIPYRESKLTRLLQDSLGGRTKTCIIATISPARSNMEETLSTLDYAIRAKSIRNKPELNQRMTRNSLLKEYIAEIERLKSDVLAAREKNGIFFSEETWNEMTAEQELRRTEIEEARKQVEIVENQMRSVREEFDQSIGLLKIREGELKETRDKLKKTEGVLVEKEGELILAKGLLEEEVVVRKAYQDTEVVLDEVAGGLKRIAKQSVQDVGGLFEKLERKTGILNSNLQAVSTHGSIISATRNTLSQKLDEFIKLSNQCILKLRTETGDFQTKELETLASHSKRIDQQLQQLQEALHVIQAKDTSEAEALSVAQNILRETHETFKIGFGVWGERLRKICEEMGEEIELTGIDALSATETALKSVTSLVESVVYEAVEYVESECNLVHEAKILADETTKNEVARLKQQNDALVMMLENERVKADKAKDELLQRISALLGEFTNERHRGLKEAVGAVQNDNNKAEERARSFVGKHGEIMDEMEGIGAGIGEKMRKRGVEGKRTRDGAFKALGNAKTNFSNELTKLQTTVSGSIMSYSNQVQKQNEAMNVSCTDAFEQHSRAKRARVEATTSLGVDAQSEYRHLRRGIASTSRNIETIAGRVVSEATGLFNATEMYRSAASRHLGFLGQASDALAQQGGREDIPTSTTPRKRLWDYPDKWELTKSRNAILKAWREQRISRVGGETFLAEHLPLPEEDQNSDVDAEPMFKLPASPSEEENTIPTSPPAASLVSSVSSTTSIPQILALPRVTKAPSSKKSFPPLEPLIDSRNVYTTRGLRRAR